MGIENTLNLIDEFKDLRTYCGYYRDMNVLKQSSSGGAASIIAEQIIQEKGVVFGAAYAEDYRSAYFIRAETLDDLLKLKGSKYIVTEKKVKVDNGFVSVYKHVVEEIKQGKKVLFIGLGCDVAAVKNYAKSCDVEDSRFFTIDLICHGPTIPSVQEEFVRNLEKRYKAKIINFSVRYKKKGWTPPYIRADFDNGKHYEKPLYETDFGYAFKVFSLKSCYRCSFKGKKHIADITVGDYWGLKEGMKGYNRNGVSVLFSHTNKGDLLISKIDRARFHIHQSDPLIALKSNRMFYESREKVQDYNKFKENLNQYGLHYAVVHSKGYKNYKKIALKKRLFGLVSPKLKRLIKQLLIQK